MNRRVLSPFFVVLALGATLSSSAFAKGEELREPEDYAADLGRWHLAHQRERQAIQTIARQFPTIKAAFGARNGALTVEQRFERIKTEDWWLAADALGTTLAAVLYTNGGYAVSNSAAKQTGQRREQTLASAMAMIERLRAQHEDDFEDSVWNSFAQGVQDRARSALRKGDYAAVVDGLLRAYPEMARLFDTVDATAFATEMQAGPGREKYLVESMVAAILRSKGEVSLNPNRKRDVDAAANLRWAVMAAESGQFKSEEIKADSLAAQPARYPEYVQFVLQTAANKGFRTVWGWQHVQRVSKQLHDDAKQEIDDIEEWEDDPKPSRIQPANRCG